MGYKPASIFDKPHICKHSLANVTAEAVRVPAIVHGLNDTTNDELPWRKSHVRDQFEASLIFFNIFCDWKLFKKAHYHNPDEHSIMESQCTVVLSIVFSQ